MNVEQIRLLIEHGVKLQFTVEPAPMGMGYYVHAGKANDLLKTIEPMTTQRKPDEPRLFMSLDTVFSLVAVDLNYDFEVLRSQRRP